MGKATCGGVVSICFATALTFTPLPEWLRLPLLFFVWTCIPLGILGWLYAHFKERKPKLVAGQIENSLSKDDAALEVSFETPCIIDPTLRVRAFRVKVTNKTDKVLQAVGLCLEEISNDYWKDKMPYEIKSLRIPYPLPLAPLRHTGQNDVFECDINPGASRHFDLIYLRVAGGSSWRLGIPPYLPEGNAPICWRSRADVEVGLCIAGVERHSTKLSVSVSARTLSKVTRSILINLPSGKEGEGPSIAHVLKNKS